MKKAYMRLLAVFMLVLFCSGCALQNKPALDNAKTAVFLTVKDDAGRVVALEHKPQRIVLLSPSFLELFYAVGGKAVGRPTSKTLEVPSDAQSLPEVGYVYNVNLEQVVSLQPDLVIAFQGMHEKLVPALEGNHIPVLLLKVKSYDDVVAKAKLFGDIAGQPEKADSVIQNMQAKIADITVKLPAQTKKVAILHATSRHVTVELETSIAGSVAKMLGLSNVAAGSKPLETDADSTPFSLETLVERDPDVILVVTMGQGAEIEKRLKADVEGNPAWSGMRAVKEKQVYMLPSDLFLLNPGLRRPDAVEYMAKIVYPEVYGRVE